jgi:hypothetical protein
MAQHLKTMLQRRKQMMKAIFTILAATLFTVSGFAQQQFRTNKLTIGSTGNTAIRVMVDGSRYSSTNGQGIVLKNLAMGYHTVKVFVKRNGRGFASNQGGGYGNSGSYQAIYTAQLLLKPNTHTDITVNRFGKVMVDEQQMGIGYYDEDDDDWGDNGNWNGNPGGYQQQAMDDRVFAQFKQTLRNERFDDSRVTLAKQTIAANWFTAAQVKDILGLFSFESNKLDIAKHAYDFTVDKGSYFVINDAFSYSSSKEELANYIRTKR